MDHSICPLWAPALRFRGCFKYGVEVEDLLACIKDALVDACDVTEEDVTPRMAKESEQVAKESVEEQIVELPVPRVMEDLVELKSLVPRGGCQQGTEKWIVDVPVPQIAKRSWTFPRSAFPSAQGSRSRMCLYRTSRYPPGQNCYITQLCCFRIHFCQLHYMTGRFHNKYLWLHDMLVLQRN